MGIWDKFRKKNSGSDGVGAVKKVYMPTTGNVITLKNIADGVFSEGVLGPGCGIEPDEEMVYAPFDGTIIQLTDTLHAIGLKSNDGMELLIHIGLDTVEMNGDGFENYVKEEDRVTKGQKLISFSKDKIKNAGYRSTIAVILCNSDEAGEITESECGNKKTGDILFTVMK